MSKSRVAHNGAELRETLEGHLVTQMDRLFASVPFAREFHEGAATERAYYTRHLLEAALRIPLNNEADAYCLAKIARQGTPATGILVKYLAEEYGHEQLLLADLRRLGVSATAAATADPFFATHLLMGYLRLSVERDGALPVLLWNWLVEWYSDSFNRKITERARAEFGAEAVAGTQAHLQIDDELNHSVNIFSGVAGLIADDQDLRKAMGYLTNYVRLIGMYFQELYDATRPQSPTT